MILNSEKKRMMVDNVKGLIDVLMEYGIINSNKLTPKGAKIINATLPYEFKSEIFCPECGAIRKCLVNIVGDQQRFDYIENTSDVKFASLPIIYKAKCLQCDKEANLVIYEGPEKIELAILRNTYGGSITKHAPEEVKYYLDQASRSRMMGALSASMAMYRVALEWLLHKQGYSERMLGEKIERLEKDIKSGEGPVWTSMLPLEMLKIIKNIGNSSMHTNGGDFSKQRIINRELLESVDVVFAELLEVIYEIPQKREDNLKKLRAIESKLKDEDK